MDPQAQAFFESQRIQAQTSRRDLARQLSQRIRSRPDPAADERIARKLLSVSQGSDLIIEDDGPMAVRLTQRDRRNLAQQISHRIINGPAQLSSSSPRYR